MIYKCLHWETKSVCWKTKSSSIARISLCLGFSDFVTPADPLRLQSVSAGCKEHLIWWCVATCGLFFNFLTLIFSIMNKFSNLMPKYGYCTSWFLLYRTYVFNGKTSAIVYHIVYDYPPVYCLSDFLTERISTFPLIHFRIACHTVVGNSTLRTGFSVLGNSYLSNIIFLFLFSIKANSLLWLKYFQNYLHSWGYDTM